MNTRPDIDRRKSRERRKNPPQMTSDRIQDALYGFTRSKLLFTAIDFQLFSHIHQGKNTVDKLAPAIHVGERALRIFMDGLVGIGFLEKNHGAYVLPQDVEKYLVESSPNYMGGMVKHCKRLSDNWDLLTDVVQSGMPAGGAQGLAHIEEHFAELVKGLYVSNYDTALELAQILEIGTRYTGLEILDVAGGSAVWSIAMLEKDPASRATVLDYPLVIHVAEEYVKKHGLESRYDYIPGDLEVLDFPQNRFDLAVLANICHAIGPYATQDLIESVAGSLKPGGRIAIVDFVPDDERSRPGWPLIFGVNMLISTDDGDVFTAAQYCDWFEKAGLILCHCEELESEVTAVIGTKPGA
jgi:ubiquinone/menaquinone biosynthesis C-methylase UbiE